MSAYLRMLGEHLDRQMYSSWGRMSVHLLGGESALAELIQRDRYAVDTDPGALDAGSLMSWDRGYAEAEDW